MLVVTLHGPTPLSRVTFLSTEHLSCWQPHVQIVRSRGLRGAPSSLLTRGGGHHTTVNQGECLVIFISEKTLGVPACGHGYAMSHANVIPHRTHFPDEETELCGLRSHKK